MTNLLIDSTVLPTGFWQTSFRSAKPRKYAGSLLEHR